MRIRVNRYLETARSSLFLVPTLSVVVAVVLGELALGIDRRLDGSASLPAVFTSTVNSARAVLTTVATATISFAGVAFSVSLLIIQLGSSQYSPQVVHTLFRDPFNKRVMGIVVGTFTYSLIVLRSVRSPFEEGGDPVIPNLSVVAAVVLGVAAILAVVSFINHSAHSMDISEILQRVARESINSIGNDWSAHPNVGVPIIRTPPAGSTSAIVRFDRAGWVQQVHLGELVRSAGANGTVRLHTAPAVMRLRAPPFARSLRRQATQTMRPSLVPVRLSESVPRAPCNKIRRTGSASSPMSRSGRCPQGSTIPLQRRTRSFTRRQCSPTCCTDHHPPA